ncbi:rsbT co-antagonist protein RsbR [Pseudoxanthomonas sp. GM95]|uniref:STAS domain-containing protein n=1 Tax=Pseudoxanthomonas sp. GM95 TaxID=1881043 RepID=UPI0008D4CAFA|nr:STAS domain-containing protein [Pseudoxanthomonas sp. GM95]SEL16991.1 rsbT co-antagonist protein RsbR [Pseudoxanthomonas sp. GM95]
MTGLSKNTTVSLMSHESTLLAEWMQNLEDNGALSDGRISRAEVEGQAREFLRAFTSAAQDGSSLRVRDEVWADARTFLDALSRSRALAGFDSSSTASFVFSMKRPIFSLLQQEYKAAPEALAEQLWLLSDLIDQLGLQTVQTFQKTREAIIARQQEELLELSTPVVKLWDGVLALPMIGTLDSQRTQVVMESLLQRIVETGSEIAIIDITGVPTVDTLVAQHLLKTVTAIRLMGADAIISGVRPQIAQTIVHLGLDLQGITTKANLADALALALKRTGQAVVRKD